MSNLWFISDTHWGHANILTFKRDDGTPVRPFASVKEMDECMFDNWNETVKPGDKVYHLGDVVFGENKQETLRQIKNLPGKKRLLIGNHDDVNLMFRSAAFETIQLWRVFGEYGFLCTHIPVEFASLKKPRMPGGRSFNVHGHIHSDLVMDDSGMVNPYYVNACVEHNNYRPINLDTILEIIDMRRDEIAYPPRPMTGFLPTMTPEQKHLAVNGG